MAIETMEDIDRQAALSITRISTDRGIYSIYECLDGDWVASTDEAWADEFGAKFVRTVSDGQVQTSDGWVQYFDLDDGTRREVGLFINIS